MTKDEALKLALAALSSGEDMQIGRVVWTEYDSSLVQEAIIAIKEALAQQEQEQEPVAWLNKERNTIIWDKIYPDMYPLYTTPPQRKPLTDEEELSNGLAMALHDAVLIRIGKDDEATQQATARIDKLVNKYKIEAAHNIKENT